MDEDKTINHMQKHEGCKDSFAICTDVLLKLRFKDQLKDIMLACVPLA